MYSAVDDLYDLEEAHMLGMSMGELRERRDAAHTAELMAAAEAHERAAHGDTTHDHLGRRPASTAR